MDGKNRNTSILKLPFLLFITAIAVGFSKYSDVLAETDAAAMPRSIPTSFWKDSQADLHFRSYTLDRDRDVNNDSQTSAISGILRFLSGKWADRFQASAAMYTSQGLLTPDNKPGTQLLKPIQKGYAVLGEAWASLKISDNVEIKGGRQLFDLPFLNKNYARQLPDTHEGYILNVKDVYNTDWLLGYVPRIKKRNSEYFVRMSEQAGVPGGKDGTSIVHVMHRWSKDTNLVVSNLNTFNVFNNSYAEFKTTFYPLEKWPIKFSIQGAYQQATGDKLLGDITTNSLGFLVSTNYSGIKWSFAGTSTAENSKLLRPFGVSPSYLSLIVQDFDRPGEDALMLGIAYDFSKIGIKNLTSYAKYASSRTPDSGAFVSPDQDEFNITFDYKISRSILDGLSLRLRYATVNQHGAGAIDFRDYHVILNYSLSIFN